LRFSFPGGQAAPMDGEMIAFEPPSAMEMRWGPDVLRIELRAVGESTELTLLQTFAQHGKAARDAAGWHVCLDALAGALDGAVDSRDHMSAWHAIHPRYVRSFGPAAATI